MQGWLRRAGIGYAHLPRAGWATRPATRGSCRQCRLAATELQALRRLHPAAAYEEGIRQLVELATAQRVAIICGEPLPWRCHRLLIANTLAARAWTVWHIIGAHEPRLHQLGRWGAAPSIDTRGRLTYPPSAAAGDALR
jgi:uncharacterized protein (DUF488 family)